MASVIKPRKAYLDPSDPINEGLVLAWPLFENRGTFLTDVADSLHGTVAVAAPVWEFNSLGVGGEGPVLSFGAGVAFTEGVNVFANQVFTIAGWVKKAAPVDGSCAFGACRGDSVNSFLIVGAQGGTNKILVMILDDAGAALLLDVGTLGWWNGNWMHIACEVNTVTRQVRVWVNNFLDFDKTYVVGASITPNRFSMGALPRLGFPAGNALSGTFADARVWNRALTALERTRLNTELWAGYVYRQPLPYRNVWDWSRWMDFAVPAGGGLNFKSIIEPADPSITTNIEYAILENDDADSLELAWLHPGTLDYRKIKSIPAATVWKQKGRINIASPIAGVRLVAALSKAGAPATGRVMVSGWQELDPRSRYGFPRPQGMIYTMDSETMWNLERD